MAAVAATIYQGEGLNVLLRFLPSRCMPAVLRAYGATIGERVRFNAPVTIHNWDHKRYYRNLRVGDDCYFGRGLFLDLGDVIIIESRVTLSHGVSILTHTDVGESPLGSAVIPPSRAPVAIRFGAYVGANVTVLQGVDIGECSAVAASAAVIRSVPSRTLVAGVPAREKRRLDDRAIE